MRKMRSSSNDASRIRFSACAEARSRPNGFSTTTRAPAVHPDLSSCVTTVPNSAGGIAR